MFRSGLVTNRGLEHISNLRQGKPPSNEQTSDEIKANLALLALKDEQIKKCESDLAISKAETASHIEVNLNIKKGIQNQRKENTNALNIDIPKNQTKNIVRT